MKRLPRDPMRQQRAEDMKWLCILFGMIIICTVIVWMATPW